MILVAFVLVLVATVTLIIGTFFDGGTAYIWISIGACVATFGVLAASYFARRRDADDAGARPQPLGAGESRPATVQSAPRGTTVGAGGTTTATRARTEAEPDAEPDAKPDAEPEAADDVTDEESTVTIVPSSGEATPDEAADEAAEEPMAPVAGSDEDAAPTPAPRRVAPRRVVRAAPVAEAANEATTDEGAAEAPPAEAAPAWPSKDAEEAPAPAATAGGGTRKVVRRVAATGGTAGGTRKVVRRASPTSGTRRVVRPVGGAPAEGQRTVRRVVRRAPAGGEETAAGAQPTQEKATPDRSGTRGKRARAVLSEIKGVGPAKQDALLKRFGSLENMAAASVDELADVKGVGRSVATALKQTLQDR